MSSSTLNNDCCAIVSETCLVVVLPERLTLLESNSFEKLLNDKIQTNQKIILDFKNTQFIDSSGIGALMNVHLSTAVLAISGRSPALPSLLRCLDECQSGFCCT